MTEKPVTGRRDRKRAATRQAIAAAALELFLARGYDRVSVSEIAEKADVATATLFNYFPSKEALVFDRDDQFDEDLADAVRGRSEGTTVIDALRAHVLAKWLPLALDPELAPRRKLIAETPALSAYSEHSWLGHTQALAGVVAAELGRPEDDIASHALARFVLSIPMLTAARDDVEDAVRSVFAMIIDGWTENG